MVHQRAAAGTGAPKQPTLLIARHVRAEGIDDRARVYARGDVKVRYRISGGAEVYAGGKVECVDDHIWHAQPEPKPGPIGVRVGHGTLTAGRTVVLGEKGVRCADTFNAVVGGRRVTTNDNRADTSLVTGKDVGRRVALRNLRARAFRAFE